MPEFQFFESESSRVTVIFFGAQTTKPNLADSAFRDKIKTAHKLELPKTFLFVNQTHSSTVVDVDQSFQQGPGIYQVGDGDALFSRNTQAAISVVTADCIPLLVFDSQSNQIAAIHAGWRGLCSKIIKNTLLNSMKFNPTYTSIWIGPHIGPKYFEVDRDVADLLAQASQAKDKVLLSHQSPNKFYVDLKEIALSQLIELGVSQHSIWSSSRETFSDTTLASYRRDRGQSLRNISLMFKQDHPKTK